jgi:hypothetical protein
VYYAAAIALLLGFRLVWHIRSAKSVRTQRVSA